MAAPGHGGHSHGSAVASPGGLYVALACSVALMAAEVVVAFVSASLTLFADAGHLLTDAGAIAGALWVMRLARRPASPVWSFGFRRAEILAAAVNGMTLLVVGVLVVVEAVRRLIHPSHVAGVPMVVLACIGVVVTLVSTLVLARADRTSLNVEGVFQHVLTDLYGFAGTAVAGIVIITTKWFRADAVMSLLVAYLVLRAAWGLLRTSGRVLLEGTPESVDLEAVRRHLFELAEVISVHDLHAWTLTSNLPALSAHVVVEESCFHDGTAAVVLDHLQDCLASHFDVEHSTFQLEPATHPEHELGTHA
ncbi:MAG: cation diffusion facilitator family transporter [Acidimicrobiales bacterium]